MFVDPMEKHSLEESYFPLFLLFLLDPLLRNLWKLQREFETVLNDVDFLKVCVDSDSVAQRVQREKHSLEVSLFPPSLIFFSLSPFGSSDI